MGWCDQTVDVFVLCFLAMQCRMESVHVNSAILLFWASVKPHGQLCKVPELVEYVGYAIFEW